MNKLYMLIKGHKIFEEFINFVHVWPLAGVINNELVVVIRNYK